MTVQSLSKRLWIRAARWSELVLWELRIQGWSRHAKSRICWVLFITLTLFCLLWYLTILNLRYGRIDSSIEASVCAVTMQTPFGEGAFSIARAGFGFILLKLCAMATAIVARLFIPGISGSGVAADRRTCRLAELRTTLYTSSEIVSAKTVSAAAIYLCAYTGILVAVSPILVLSGASAWQIALICLEMAGSVLLIAALSVTCSVLVSYGNYGRALAYLVCWIPFPILWAAAVTFAGHMPENQMLGVMVGRIPVRDWYIESLIEFQIVFSALIILSAHLVSVRRLFPRERTRKGAAK